MILRDRLQWISRMALLLFIFSSVAFLSALTAMRLAIQGREVAMPDLSGKQSTEAQKILQDHHLGFQVEAKVYSELPADTVIRQSPPANMHVKAGQDAHVILSLGPQRLTIPALQDLSLRAAQVELLRDGMQLGEVSNMNLPGTDKDTVVQQDPAPGTSDVTSPHLNLLVSLEPPATAYCDARTHRSASYGSSIKIERGRAENFGNHTGYGFGIAAGHPSPDNHPRAVSARGCRHHDHTAGCSSAAMNLRASTAIRPCN